MCIFYFGTVELRKKIWTLKEARSVFPRIYQITEEYYNIVEKLKKELEKILPEKQQERIEDEIQRNIEIWVMKMYEFGVEVKGLWLVDFDNGRGYYCWKYNEPDILYEHDYESGFKGRKPIREDES